MKKSLLFCELLAVFVFLIGLESCNLPQTAQLIAPTLNVTQAYQTVEARLTSAVALTPTVTVSPAPTGTGEVTETPTIAPATVTPRQPTPTSSPTVVCDKAAPGNPIDVSIPDDTQMRPGQSFTKTWRLQNVGSCAWTREYRVELFSGEAMSAPSSIILPREVSPGQQVDISVDMIAPQSAGTYQGNWKLRNAEHAWFGIGPVGTSPFWVRIIVVPLPTATITPTLATPTPTATPAIQASGVITLAPDDRLDLDNAQLNTGDGEDLSYERNEAEQLLLIPQGNAVMAVYGTEQPTMANCQAATLSAAPVFVEELAEGTYLCYRTNLGLPGQAQVSSFIPEDLSLTLNMLTWTIP